MLVISVGSNGTTSWGAKLRRQAPRGLYASTDVSKPVANNGAESPNRSSNRSIDVRSKPRLDGCEGPNVQQGVDQGDKSEFRGFHFRTPPSSAFRCQHGVCQCLCGLVSISELRLVREVLQWHRQQMARHHHCNQHDLLTCHPGAVEVNDISDYGLVLKVDRQQQKSPNIHHVCRYQLLQEITFPLSLGFVAIVVKQFVPSVPEATSRAQETVQAE